MTRKHDWTRNWTWDIVHHYHKCPKCDYIIESRRDYEKRNQIMAKDLSCRRCSHKFTLSKKIPVTFGPFMGE